MRRSISLVVALGVVLAAPAAGAITLGSLAPTTSTYLIGYEPGTVDDVARLVRVAGGVVQDRSDTLGVLVASGLTATALKTLIIAPAVTYAEPEMPTRLAGAQWNGAQWNGAQWDGAQWDGAQWNGGSGGNGSAWGLDAIHAPASWANASGDGSARLCVVDSGVDGAHTDLAPNMGEIGIDVVAGTSDARDVAGHGTHVAGIAAAARDDGAGATGVADGRILSARVLSADGRGTVSDLAVGMTWCADHGADVALLALSVDGYSRTVERAIDYLESRGVVVVASAGNGGPCSSCVSFPASDPRVLAVAAVKPDGTTARFSAAGPQVALAAPGVGITSTFLGGGYATGSGTSQAAAFVAGAALAIRDEHPDASASAVRAALVGSARDLGPAGRDAATGAGLLDVEAALRGI